MWDRVRPSVSLAASATFGRLVVGYLCVWCVPSLNLNDGPQGFRGIPGTSTCWPSGLTVAATWNTSALLLWGTSMGEEFVGKGANVQLGPGVCVARVPVNGRNFEYVSGEDPFLGYTLVQPLIRGIQSQVGRQRASVCLCVPVCVCVCVCARARVRLWCVCVFVGALLRADRAVFPLPPPPPGRDRQRQTLHE